jgi:hypothetical protein
MIIFCLSIHHLWGRTMQSYTEDRAIAYADDGYIYISAPLSVALRILADLKQVFKDDAGLELNMLKTQLLVKGISNHDAYSAAKGFFENDACLSSIKDTITLASFTAEGYVGLGPWH